MPNKSRNKGDRSEREIVNLHLERGFQCERTLESGKRSNSPVVWDINLHTTLGTLKGESKVRAKGFKEIYAWKEGNDFLCIKADRRKRLYVIDEDMWLKVMHPY